MLIIGVLAELIRIPLPVAPISGFWHHPRCDDYLSKANKRLRIVSLANST